MLINIEDITRRIYEFYFRVVNIDYFMESARVRCLRTSCKRIRNRTSEHSERVRFLHDTKQRVRKHRAKHFPCCNLFILYILRFFRPEHVHIALKCFIVIMKVHKMEVHENITLFQK